MKQTIRLINADVTVGLKTIADESVDTIVTSPPYFSLRSYKSANTVWDDVADCEHEWSGEVKINTRHKAGESNPGKESWFKDKDAASQVAGQFCSKCGAWRGQLGAEPDFHDYVRHVHQITAELMRVLKPTGVFCLNIGDTYYGSGGAGGDYAKGGLREGQPKYKQSRSDDYKAKCMCGIPERVMLGCIDQGWILRDKIQWIKKVWIGKTNKTIGNAMPSSAGDRCCNTSEIVYMFVKNQTYWTDMDAIRTPYTEPLDRWGGARLHPLNDHCADWDNGTGQSTYRERDMRPNSMGATSPNVWQINTKPFTSGIEGVDHFALFPELLASRLITAFCPSEVCLECGHVRKRIIESNEDETIDKCYNSKLSNELGVSSTSSIRTKQVIGKQTTGWTSCSCNKGYNPGVVLDCFSGAATTLLAARNLGRSAIGIEISADYCKIAKKRVGFDQSTIDGSIEYIYKVIT